MVKRYVWTALLIIVVLTGCGGTAEEESPTAVPTLPPIPTTVTEAEPPAATATVPPPPPIDVTLPAQTSEATATTANPATSAPITEPTAEPPPAVEATSQPITEPPSGNGELLLPGQSSVGELEGESFAAFPYQGERFSPRLFFVQPAGSLDAELRAYVGMTAPEGVNLVNPAATTNFGGAGVPEMLVYTAQADEVHFTAVANLDNTAGRFRFYLFDGVTQTENTAVLEQLSLAAGETKSYPATSQDGNPLIVFADPLGTAEDITLTVRDSDNGGAVVNTANFGGGGSAEALFLLPLRTTNYTVEISEVNGQAATVNVHIIALGAPNLGE